MGAFFRSMSIGIVLIFILACTSITVMVAASIATIYSRWKVRHYRHVAARTDTPSQSPTYEMCYPYDLEAAGMRNQKCPSESDAEVEEKRTSDLDSNHKASVTTSLGKQRGRTESKLSSLTGLSGLPSVSPTSTLRKSAHTSPLSSVHPSPKGPGMATANSLLSEDLPYEPLSFPPPRDPPPQSASGSGQVRSSDPRRQSDASRRSRHSSQGLPTIEETGVTPDSATSVELGGRSLFSMVDRRDFAFADTNHGTEQSKNEHDRSSTQSCKPSAEEEFQGLPPTPPNFEVKESSPRSFFPPPGAPPQPLRPRMRILHPRIRLSSNSVLDTPPARPEPPVRYYIRSANTTHHAYPDSDMSDPASKEDHDRLFALPRPTYQGFHSFDTREERTFGPHPGKLVELTAAAKTSTSDLKRASTPPKKLRKKRRGTLLKHSNTSNASES